MGIELSRRRLLTGVPAGMLLLILPTDKASAGGVGGAAWRAELRELERVYAGRIGAFAVDTGTGATVSHRADERFPLLSTFKVLAAAAILHRARRHDPGLLERLIRWTEADLVPYSPITSLHVADGLTVAELCWAAIAHSDNTAGNLLIKQIGGPEGLTRYARRLGDARTRLDRWETELNDWAPDDPRDTTTPAAMGRNLQRLTLGDALDTPDRLRLVGWLRESVTGGARIRAGLPADWDIGDKTGTGPTYGAANDIAFAQPPTGAPLIISIYTNRSAPDRPNDNAVIADTATILARALGRL